MPSQQRPICVRCRMEYINSKNGVIVKIMMADGKPYQLWNADVWICPGCGHDLLGGFAERPFARNYDLDFSKVVKDLYQPGVAPVYEVYESVSVRDANAVRDPSLGVTMDQARGWIYSIEYDMGINAEYISKEAPDLDQDPDVQEWCDAHYITTANLEEWARLVLDERDSHICNRLQEDAENQEDYNNDAENG